MNATRFGILAGAIDGDGFGLVAVGDATRRVWFQPERFVAPWPVPGPGDAVAVATGTPQWIALWVIKRGAPTYTYRGG